MEFRFRNIPHTKITKQTNYENLPKITKHSTKN
jgi:hypothetical protein